ncbi:MAG: hypothetical protein EBV03_13235 [Proteobacteria bacterium]|nr:hypothetical protein [Pseudomonadota bacterium]
MTYPLENPPALTHLQRTQLHFFRCHMHDDIKQLGMLMQKITNDFGVEGRIIINADDNMSGCVANRIVQEGRRQWQNIQDGARNYFKDDKTMAELAIAHVRAEALGYSQMSFQTMQRKRNTEANGKKTAIA